jgi:catechol O-methyltransferase
MALPFRVRLDQVPTLLRFGLREGWRSLADAMRGKGPRVERALDTVRADAARGDPESVLAVLDAFARNQSFLMNVGDRKGEILDQQVRELRPRRALELGAFCGYSAVRIGRLLREWNGHLDSIEVSRRNVAVAESVVGHAGLSATVAFHHGSAEQVIPSLAEPYDLVFIDHWKDLYLPDLRRIEEHRLLRSGSVVVADNIAFFDASEYLDHVRNSGRYDSRYIESTLEYNDDMVDALEVSVFR